jgi:hypothetical protein
MIMIMTGIYCSTQLNGNRNLQTSLKRWHQPIMVHMAWMNDGNATDEDHVSRVIAVDATVTNARTSLLRAQIVIAIILVHWARFLKWYIMFLACIVRRDERIMSGTCPPYTFHYALHLEPLYKVILKATYGQPVDGLIDTHNVQTENTGFSCLKKFQLLSEIPHGVAVASLHPVLTWPLKSQQGHQPIITEIFPDCPQSLQANAKIAHQIRPHPLPCPFPFTIS